MKKQVLITLFLAVLFLSAKAQVYDPVSWSFSSKKLSGDTYELTFEAKIEKGWHMYGLKIPEGGPIATSIIFSENPDIEFISDLVPTHKPKVKFDPTFEMEVELFDTRAEFKRNVRILTNSKIRIDGIVEFMVCDDIRCLPPKEESFIFSLKSERTVEIKEEVKNEIREVEGNSPPVFETNKIDIQTNEGPSDTAVLSETKILAADEQSVPEEKKEDPQNKTLLGLLLFGIVAGFGAVITPCVYPVIPLTVSFFMRETSRSKAISSGLFFGLSIVLIYTSVGLIVGVFRIDLVRLISSHWLPNVVFFLLFMVFAFSFFGLFEITLPSSWSNRIDQRADKGGILGPFFMALATVVISFSCTGLFAGAVLAGALQGEIIRPVVGMFGFSFAFALPFTLLAIFPGFISKLPKSGGWLNSVKVFFAFLLLATSLMFVTNLRLPFFTKEIAIAIIIVILILLGLYLLGKIKFAHDSDLPYISIPRLLLAIAIFSFALRLVPGLFGYPVNGIAIFIPQNSSYEKAFKQNVISTQKQTNLKSNTCTDIPKYNDILELPLGLGGYFDYNEALACAKELGKPVLLDFAGHSCKNCKKMYAEVWSDSRVLDRLQNDFVIAALYTDDRTKIPEADWVKSELDGKVKKTIGKKFNDLQISKFGSNALPLYAIVDPEGNVLTSEKYYTYSPDVEAFILFLDEGIRNFVKK